MNLDGSICANRNRATIRQASSGTLTPMGGVGPMSMVASLAVVALSAVICATSFSRISSPSISEMGRTSIRTSPGFAVLTIGTVLGRRDGFDRRRVTFCLGCLALRAVGDSHDAVGSLAGIPKRWPIPTHKEPVLGRQCVRFGESANTIRPSRLFPAGGERRLNPRDPRPARSRLAGRSRSAEGRAA